MTTQLINTNNLKQSLKEIGQQYHVSANIQAWLDGVAHNHWKNKLPQGDFNDYINEPWFIEQSKHIKFKKLILTPIFRNELGHLIDFLKSEYGEQPINKLNYLQCEIQAKDWVRKLNEKTSLQEDLDGLKTLVEIEFEGQNYKLVELVSKQAIRREGKIMHNCISGMAEKTEEELAGEKFYSIRDSDNNSLVSLSSIPIKYQEPYAIEDTKKILQEYIKPGNLEPSTIKKIRGGLVDDYILKSHLDYGLKFQKDNQSCHEFNEIKEKFNELPGQYLQLTKNILNKAFKTTHIKYINRTTFEDLGLMLYEKNEVKVLCNLDEYDSSSNIFYLSNKIKNEIDKLSCESSKKVDFNLLSYSNFLNFDGFDINLKFAPKQKDKPPHTHLSDNQDYNIEKDYKQIKFQNYNKKTFSFNFKEKLNIDIKNCQQVQYNIVKDAENIKHSSVGEIHVQNSDIDIHMNNQCVSYKDPSDNPLYIIAQDSNISIKASDFKLGVLSIDSNINEKEIIASKKEFSSVMSSNPILISVNTKNSTLNVNGKNYRDTPIHYFFNFEAQSLQACPMTLEEFIKKSMDINNILVSCHHDKFEVSVDREPYKTNVIIPAHDKETLTACINNHSLFKDKIVEKLIQSSQYDIYKNDFEKLHYFSQKAKLNLKNIFDKLIKKSNQKANFDAQEVNYLEVANQLKLKLEDCDIYRFFTPENSTILNIFKHSMIENGLGHRINNSRTKLSKNFVERLLPYVLDYDYDNGSFHAEPECVEQVRQFLLSPLDRNLTHNSSKTTSP